MTALQRRLTLATTLVTRLEPEARSLGRAQGWRQATLETLLQLSVDRLEALQHVHGVDDLFAELTIVPLASSTTEDLVYTPIPPCRYVDTRIAGGQINGTRGFDLSLSGSAYGGSATCNPTALFGVGDDEFGAVAMNVTIVAPLAAPGFLALKPTVAAPTTSLVNWYEIGAQVANFAIVTTDQSALAEEFVAQSSAPVHVIVDISGAFLASPRADAFATYREVGDSRGVINLPRGTFVTVGSLDLPAGSYVVSASLFSVNASGTDQGLAYCILQIGNRNAQGIETVPPQVGIVGQAASVALTVADRLLAPAAAVLRCTNNNGLGGDLSVGVFTMNAISVASLTFQP